MKKKLIIITVSIILIVLLLIGINYKRIINIRNQKHYAKIKENIDPEIEAYLRLSHPYCSPSNGVTTFKDETLVYQRGMDKELLLDVDGKSYCKVRIEVRCVEENKHEWNTYLKCKDYEDEHYRNWETRKN